MERRGISVLRTRAVPRVTERAFCYRGVQVSPQNARKKLSLDHLSVDAMVNRFLTVHQRVQTALLTNRGLIASAERLASTLREAPPESLVLGGAGTSGRIAFALAREFSAQAAQRGVRIVPWIAGGPQAIRRTIEGAEDDMNAARNDLRPFLEKTGNAFIGISSGLSAPCVAAGLSLARDFGARHALFGNNPGWLAPEKKLAGVHDHGVRGFIQQALDSRNSDFFPLFAVVGPEVLAGSSRLSGGTSTYALLHAILSAAFGEESNVSQNVMKIMELSSLSKGNGSFFAQIKVAMDRFVQAYQNGGNIFYLGRGVFGQAGVLDASECPPTFGVGLSVVRGFVEGGWNALLPKNASESAQLSHEAPCDWMDVPAIQPHDLLIHNGFRFPAPRPRCDILEVDFGNSFLGNKFALNVISTGAFTRVGKVLNDRMIDLVPSNEKLVQRAIGVLVSVLGEERKSEARGLLIQALEAINDQTIGSFGDAPDDVLAAFAKSGAIPSALILASGGSAEDIQEFLQKRRPIAEVLENLKGR